MPMMGAQKEIYGAVCTMLKNVKPAAVNKPDANIGAAYQDFDSLLSKAKQHFSSSDIVKTMEPLGGATTLVHLVAKLPSLRAAIEGVIPWEERLGD